MSATNAKEIRPPMSPTQGELFFNTVSLTGDELKEKREKASSQNVRVYTLMKIANMSLSPEDVWRMYCAQYAMCPLTSIRRAITTLTKDGHLTKLPLKKKGMYGMDIHKWKAL